MFILGSIRTTDPYLQCVLVKFYLGHFNGEVHPDLVGGDAARGGLFGDLAEGGAADEVGFLKEVVGVPEVFGGGGEKGDGAGAVFGGDVLFEEFHFVIFCLL